MRMQIRTIQKGFDKFYPLELDWNHSNANSNYSKGLVAFKPNLKHLNANSNHSKGIRNMQMQIRTIQKGFEVFESKFDPLERDSNTNSNHSKGIGTI